MVKKTLMGMVRLGRTTALILGLAVVLAMTVGLASSALGANGKPFLLGKRNVAAAVSALIKQGPGPALSLAVRPGQPPLKVNSGGKVANLNADRLDGLDSAAFQRNGAKAADTDKLDGKDSALFFSGSTYDREDRLQGQGLGVGQGLTCDGGDVPVGGGYTLLSANEHIVTEDRVWTNIEDAGRQGWRVETNSPTPGIPAPYDLFIHVRCADLGTPHQ